MKTLAAILPMDQMVQKAKIFGNYLWGRWDVPHGKETTRDLEDKRAILSVTDDRRSKVSQILPHETVDMSVYNPALVVMVSLLPVLAVLTTVGFAFDNKYVRGSLFLALSLPSMISAGLVGWILRQCRERVVHVVSALGFGYALPLFGFMLSKIGSGVSLDTLDGMWQRFSMAFYILAALIALLGTISFFNARAREPLGLTLKFIFYGAGSIVVAGAIHPVLIFPTCLILGSFAAVQMVRRWDKDRAAEMLSMGHEFGGEGSGMHTLTHIQARKDQAARCVADKTPLFFIGRSQAELYDRGDVFAADRDLPVLASVNDLSTHLVIFGGTGRGKTVYALNRLQTQWMAMKQGGMIYIDPKSDGALKFAHLPNYTVLRPTVRNRLTGEVVTKGVNVNPIQGIEPGKVTDILASVSGAVNNIESSSGNAQFFIDNAKSLAFHAEQLLFWYIETQKHQVAIGNENAATQKKWHWNLADLRKMINYIAEFNPKNRSMSFITPIVEYIHEHGPAAGRDETLNTTMTWFKTELPTISGPDNDTWKSVVSQALQWFAPLMGDDDLISWATCAESEADIAQAFYGQCFGIYLPLKHGAAGEITMALLRYRINEIARRRNDDWRTLDPNATPVLMVIDEAQEVINRQDNKILSMGRSIGLYMWLATQSEAALRAKLNEVTTETVINNLLSFICFDVDNQTFEVIQEKVGKCWKKQKRMHSAAIDYEQNALAMAKSPMFDREHPGAGRYWDHLGAQGAGIPLPEKIEYRSHATGQVRSGNFEENMGRFAEKHMFPDLIVGEGNEEKYILEAADFNVLKRGQGSALVSINRGGEPRRDMVKLTPFPVPTIEEFWFMQAYFQRTGMWPEEVLSKNPDDEEATYKPHILEESDA